MTQDSLITLAMQQAVGQIVSTEVAGVERGAIRRFAEAIEDLNPLYMDESAARSSGYRDVIAPPTFFRSLQTATPTMPDGDIVPRLLDGGSAWEYFEPVCAGDRITLATTMESLTERRGRLGKMLFIVYATEYTNQDGNPVAVQRNTIIRY
jgi:acyl dehydratase